MYDIVMIKYVDINDNDKRVQKKAIQASNTHKYVLYKTQFNQDDNCCFI